MQHREPGLDAKQLRHYGENLAAFWRIASVVMMITALACLLLQPAHAQTTPTVTFGASVTNANGSLSTRLTWSSTPAATSCTGSGHPTWNGTKAASGTQDLAPITLSGTYTLTLACTWPGNNTAILEWTAPTQNTDGTALTNLAGYKIQWGTSAGTLSNTFTLAQPAATTYTVTGLTPATWYFGIRAYNSANVESDLSGIVSKTVTASQTQTSSVTLTVNPVPNAPGGVTVR